MATSFVHKAQSGRPEYIPTEDLLRQICRNELGKTVTSLELIAGQGLINHVFRVALNDATRVILRLVKSPVAYTNYDKEIWCLRYLQDCKEFRIPAPLGRGRLDTFEYMVEEYIEGKPGNDPKLNTLELWRKLGRCASEFNRLPTIGYGDTMDCSTGHFTSSWEEVLAENLQVIFRDDYWVTSGACSELHIRQLRSAFDALRELKGPTGLVHIDLGPKNCIVAPDGGIALIDWEMAEGGITPYSQLGSVAGWWGVDSEIYRSFCEGYQELGGSLDGVTTIVKMLALINSLHSVRWAQDNDPRQVDEHTTSAAWMVSNYIGDIVK